MTLQVNSLLDTTLRGTGHEDPAIASLCAKASALIPKAHKFSVLKCDAMEAPELVEYANLLCVEGILHLPYPICYFEFPDLKHAAAAGLRCTAVLAQETDMGVSCIGFGRRDIGNWEIAQTMCGWIKADAAIGRRAFFWFKELRSEEFQVVTSAEMAASGACRAANLVGLAAAMMDLRECNQKVVTHKQRAADKMPSGRKPLYDHTVLTISARAREAIRAAQGSGGLIPRRAHHRRGHLRHLATKVVPVAPCFVRGEGFVSKEYRLQ